MQEERIRALIAIGKGVALSAVLTIICMLLTAALIVFVSVSDQALTIINQIIKLISIVSGTFLSVRTHRKRGFALGACVGLIYMVLGCAMYYTLAGGSFTPASLAAEFSIGGVIGALAGSLAANLAAVRK